MRENSTAIVGVGGFLYRIRFEYVDWDSKVTGYRETFCSVTREGDGSETTGEASSMCAPMDNYVKATGRKQAFKRAIWSFPRAVRHALWATYWHAFPKDR